MQRNQIYNNFENRYDKQIALLEADKGMTERNRALIDSFQNHLFAIGCGQARVAKVTWSLRYLCKQLDGKNFDDLDRFDMERLISRINRDPTYSASSRNDHRRIVKQFFRWYEDIDPRLESSDDDLRRKTQALYKYIFKHVKNKDVLSDVDVGSILTDDDIKTVIQKGCRLDYERAFLSLLHERGPRIGELLNMRIKDVITDRTTHWLVRFDGKTGERVVPIRKSVPHLATWLNNHPLKSDPNGLLWVSGRYHIEGRPLRHIGAAKLIKRCFARANVKKKLNPHHFRHSRATLLVWEGYNDAVICQFMGWTQNSDQIKRYRHMSGNEAEDAFLRHHGIVKDDRKDDGMVQCDVCGGINESKSRYCNKCGKAMSTKVVYEDEELKSKATDEAFDLLAKILSDPDLLQKFQDFTAEKERFETTSKRQDHERHLEP